ncbi:uncharacterized protein K02A2.6-like [Macrosteles quadrilineatus]|uniref:uncharacterized protein K02A2.6-like n=1 Tax=Macrosteles quadrilineatus TaxID=74068 RepID=UPI0023E302CB|nr:uncharacterized protein K02A2.6-like [Macrosteles quadrilineatus]
MTSNQKRPSPLFESLKGKCYRCGSQNHRANNCEFASKICNKCKKQGHLARVCLGSTRTKIHQAEEEDCQDEQHEIFKIDRRNGDKIMLDLSVEGKPVQMELDTGSAISTLSYSTFKKLEINRKIFHTQVQLRTYTREVFKPKRVVFVHCTYKDQEFTGKLYIVDDNLDAIFGRDWLREVQLDWAELKAVQHYPKVGGLDNLLEKFKDVFEPGIGKIPDQLGHLQLVDEARPVFMKARPVPYALKLKVEQELDRLEEAGIISKTQESEWGTPIVPVVKPNGDVRICADYKVTVNKQIQDEHHPIPKIEDIFVNMNGGKLFCTLDLRNAYLHLEMDSDSANIQTLSTHKGQYRVHRLMFGIKVAPGIWQKTMDKTLAGLEGIQCFFDDIVIQGNSEEELLLRLESVLGKLREKGLRLNRDKCKFLQRRIHYLGHVIDEKGIHKCMDKVAAIAKARKPENVSELRIFLGLVNYYNRFIKDLATLLKPLHKLLQKGNKYVWNEQCEQSFQQIKKVISSDTVLCHYSPELPLVLATDASPVGLGAVISHRFPDGTEKPIAFASRTLTKPEEKYSQIDKEATGIIWGLKKFFTYCYGRKFTLVTDHKPLVTIFNLEKNLPSMSATRLFNYSHYLSGFDYSIEFRRSNEHRNADFLSRFPTETQNSTCIDQIDVFLTSQINQMSLDHKLVAKETSHDTEMNKIVHALQNGQSVEKLGFHDGELSLHEGCILKGWRVVIPKSLTKIVLNELHFGHMGVLKTKALARSFCYWKGQDKDIEEMIASCRACREKQNAPHKEVTHPWIPATRPWERIHIDFAGPTNGLYFLLVIDAFTKWIEVLPTKCTTATWTVKELRKMFSTFGLPDLVSDNGRQFTSLEFTSFLEQCGITHKTTAPYHPSSNGQAERFVQTVKKSLKCMEKEPGTIDEKIHRFLMQIRQAPNSTGTSSYFLMFNRKIRTYLSLLKPRGKHEPTSPKGIMRRFNPGDRVQVRNYSGRDKWALGTVEIKDGNLHYYVKMDDGQTWRRHVDQMLRTKL